MTDQDFEALKRKIERVTIKLEELQKAYQGQTGQRFIRPLRPFKRR